MPASDQLLKKAIWLYFILLIFEGAIRKWVFPGLATPLLIVRDPIALLIVAKTLHRGLFPFHPYLIVPVLIGITSIFTATFLGHGNMMVALYGARIFLLHFPMMFAIGRLFNQDDVIKIGKVTLWMAIPMAFLIALQFYSPQTAWVNRGVGGDVAGAGFSGALGYLRPPGTFSFTNGLTLFYGFVASFIIYFWFNTDKINKLILIGATSALLAAIPLSISRGLFFQIGVSLIFAITAVSRKPKYAGKFVLASIGIGITLLLLSQTSFFETATVAFTTRFELATTNEDGLEGVLLDRYLGGLIGSFKDNQDLPFFGYGVGMGTNVGSMLLSGSKTFLISEGEWGRLIGELGLFLGLAVILIRLGFSLKIAIAAYRKLVAGDLLPWMLLSFGLLIVPQGQWAQPSALGFSTLIGGLMIASLRPSKSKALLP
ncbi:hypothetical protein FOA19_02645 [Rufibacter hautae]|uniref:O-antigen ligase domain-containing protein n=1 Tax=Rufibacter hautae TaxID=2595005 RepID=A0A5B6TMV3_9BACT|nr:hypothetical protein FOA19_02645 [Rufibacter hautae]